MAAFIKSKYTFILIFSALIFFLGFYLIQPKEEKPLAASAIATMHTRSTALSDDLQSRIGVAISGALPALPSSLMGTEIDCPLKVDKEGALVLNMGVRRCFDYFFSAIGEKTEDQLTNDIRQYLKVTLPATAQVYALNLLSKYVNYRHAEAPPSLQTQDKSADSLQTSLEALKILRLRYFTKFEAEAFFGGEEAYDQYNINLMRVANDASLSKIQKESRIAELIAQLPPSLAKHMTASQQYDVLQKKTEEVQSRGGSAQELYTVRASMFGVEAADRLAKLDSENADWRQRLNDYLNARQQIKANTQDADNQQQAMTTLRNQAFSTPEERLRAQTYESMRDRGDNRSF